MVREKKGDNLVTINVLEFVVEIINYVAVLVHHQENPNWAGHHYPVCLNWTDNCTARAWLRKAALKYKHATLLQKVVRMRLSGVLFEG